uniref:COesterase domain-containing protein n=1 Tax=Globodera pallida TaxID=36090 RepID=A0A183CAU1_GLOPA
MAEIIVFFTQFVQYSDSQFSSASSHQHQQQNKPPPPPPPQTQQIHSVNTPFGVLRGLVVNPVDKSAGAFPALKPVTQFLGIPYGSAPTSNHRFKMAISASKWTHQPKDAFKAPPSCIQSGLPTLLESKALKVTSVQRFDRLHRVLPLLKPQSEDCLFINLFVPEREPRLSPQAFFVFAHEASQDQPSSGLRGSFTGDHLPYILGTPLIEDWLRNGEENHQQFSAEDMQLSRVMITYVTNFVKSGDPTRPQPMLPLSSLEDRFQGIPWPQFSASTREAYMEITKDRPRMKNYYRNSFVQFWSAFIPILNRMGGKDVSEEHHLLPAHFDRATFFGVPRSFTAARPNIPFPPPPPPPPTPFPKELRDKLLQAATVSSTKRPSPESGESQIFPSKMPEGAIISKSAEFNPNWGWMALAGVALTVVNLCILIAISRKCVRRRSESKKKFQYQSYATGGVPPSLPGMDMNFALMAHQQQQEHERRHSLHPQQCFQHHRQQHFVPSPQKTLVNNKNTNNNKNNNSGSNNNNNEDDNNNNTNNVLNKMRLSNKQVAVDFVDEAAAAASLGRGSSVAGLFDAVRANEAAIARRRQSVLWLRMRRGGDSLSSAASGSGGGGDAAPAPTTATASSFGGQTSPSMVTTNSNRKPPTAAVDTARRVSTGSSAGSSVFPGISENAFSKRASLQAHQEPLLSASSKSSTPAPTFVQIQSPSANSGLIRLGPTGISPTCPRHGRAAQLLLAKASAVNSQGAEGAATGQQQQQQLDEIQV